MEDLKTLSNRVIAVIARDRVIGNIALSGSSLRAYRPISGVPVIAGDAGNPL